MKVTNALAPLLSLLMLDAVVALPQMISEGGLAARDVVDARNDLSSRYVPAGPIAQRAAAPEPVAALQKKGGKTGNKGQTVAQTTTQSNTTTTTTSQASAATEQTGTSELTDPALETNPALETDPAKLSGAAQTGAAQLGKGKKKGGKQQSGTAQPTGTAQQNATATQSGASQTAEASSAANNTSQCTGTLTGGLQVKEGSCNPIAMGQLPSRDKMLSQLITFPGPGASSNLTADSTFTILVKVANLAAGRFSNAQTQYYSQPQSLENGVISGHTHVTVQDMGPNFNPQQPLDPQKFVFFKGINDAGDGQGTLSANVTGGLPKGNYRVCTIGTAFTHQPALMPVARRGAQEDCQKFSVA
ncbi:MAG: hypothetical protein M1840_007621 [Geoglossum simile]|nr:MAG: hypothetical protein M1840_007621 [Geoglossum simile]